jgi:DNA-binding NtrC family response regulator
VEDRTITSDRWHAQAAAEPGAQPQLVMIAISDQPHEPSSRHLLAGLDEVHFGRGDRAAIRSRRDGRNLLELRIPDGRMSSSHGRLMLREAGWTLEDPDSKNGALVEGELDRCAVLADGAMIELGHTFFLFREAPVEREAAPDMSDADLRGSQPALHTFDGALAERFAHIEPIAASESPLVLRGETGTGKELVAQAFHALSRRGGAFVAVNCGALPGDLVEAELFGHRRGAFTGALADRLGQIRSAHGGTLFLDEIGELPAAAQPALLRVLQEREVVPVGLDHAVKVDIRLCSASLRDLDALSETGRFRDDLYARISGFTLELPPLRARKVDLGLLIRRLLAKIPGGAQVELLPAALRAMLRYRWPHNIRELEKVLTTAVALAAGGVIDATHLAELVRRSAPGGPPAPAPRPVPAPAAAPAPSPDKRRDRLIEALTRHHGNVVAVARELKVGRGQLYRVFKRHEIDAEAFRRDRKPGEAGSPDAAAASGERREPDDPVDPGDPGEPNEPDEPAADAPVLPESRDPPGRPR